MTGSVEIKNIYLAYLTSGAGEKPGERLEVAPPVLKAVIYCV